MKESCPCRIVFLGKSGNERFVTLLDFQDVNMPRNMLWDFNVTYSLIS